jgi:hypothetical protein
LSTWNRNISRQILGIEERKDNNLIGWRQLSRAEACGGWKAFWEKKPGVAETQLANPPKFGKKEGLK